MRGCDPTSKIINFDPVFLINIYIYIIKIQWPMSSWSLLISSIDLKADNDHKMYQVWILEKFCGPLLTHSLRTIPLSKTKLLYFTQWSKVSCPHFCIWSIFPFCHCCPVWLMFCFCTLCFMVCIWWVQWQDTGLSLCSS